MIELFVVVINGKVVTHDDAYGCSIVGKSAAMQKAGKVSVRRATAVEAQAYWDKMDMDNAQMAEWECVKIDTSDLRYMERGEYNHLTSRDAHEGKAEVRFSVTHLCGCVCEYTSDENHAGEMHLDLMDTLCSTHEVEAHKRHALAQGYADSR